MKELESEGWEDFLDMTISQAILRAASNIMPETSRSEIAACEPYFIGSHQFRRLRGLGQRSGKTWIPPTSGVTAICAP